MSAVYERVIARGRSTHRSFTVPVCIVRTCTAGGGVENVPAVTRTLSADDFDFSESASTLVYSDSLRFILPVPKLKGGGEPLHPPRGEKAGESFKDRHGRPIEGRGIVFFNPADDCWQVALGNGAAVIIIAPVTEDQGDALMAKARSLSRDPERLTLEQLKAMIRYAIDNLKMLGAFNSTRAYIAERMTPVDPAAPPGLGLHRRKVHDYCYAVFVPGAGRFLGPAATPQVFKKGAVILRQGDDVRLLQPTWFADHYRFPDGRPAHVSELKVQDPAR